jgi:adenosine kinase
MKIILTGSVAFDYLMTFPGYFKDHILPEKINSISLSFLVDSMTRLKGGVAPNIAYTLALFGERPLLWAAVGDDFSEYRAWLESQGVDTTGARVIPDVATASYFANTDRANNQIASFFPGAMAYASQLSLRELKSRPDLVVISPNDPKAMNLYISECCELGYPYIYDPSQQIIRLSKDEIHRGIESALGLFVNDYESALVQKVTGFSPELIARRNKISNKSFVVVTRGEVGVDIYQENRIFHIPSVPPERILDPTGVGDAFRGGFLTGYMKDFDLLTCGRMGVLCATYCLEMPGPQGHSFSKVEFIQRFRKHFDDRGLLDRLLDL